jgi:hypothetical protein
LLGLLGCGLGACLLLGCPPKAAQVSLPPADGGAAGACTLPRLNGFLVLRAPDRYTSANLWEYLDGGAEQIIELRMQQLCVYDLRDLESGAEVRAEIYTLAAADDARRLFALWKMENGEAIASPRPAWRAGNTLSFYQDHRYVRLYTNAEAIDATRLLQRTFELICANLG